MKPKSDLDLIKAEENLELLAVEAGKELLSKTSQKWGEVQAEYTKDLAGFAFRCARWGDWLELSVARGNSEPYIGSFFLNHMKEMKLTLGRVPDFKGESNFDYYCFTGGNTVHSTSWDDNYRKLFVLDKVNIQPYFNSYGYNNKYKIKHKIVGLPRYAADDIITFSGIGVLYLPAGKGEEVYRQILEVKNDLDI